MRHPEVLFLRYVSLCLSCFLWVTPVVYSQSTQKSEETPEPKKPPSISGSVGVTPEADDKLHEEMLGREGQTRGMGKQRSGLEGLEDKQRKLEEQRRERERAREEATRAAEDPKKK